MSTDDRDLAIWKAHCAASWQAMKKRQRQEQTAARSSLPWTEKVKLGTGTNGDGAH